VKLIEINTVGGSTYLVNVEHIVRVLIVKNKGNTDLSIYSVDGSDYHVSPEEAE
jgi:hypothetical protein